MRGWGRYKDVEAVVIKEKTRALSAYVLRLSDVYCPRTVFANTGKSDGAPRRLARVG